MSSSVPEVPAKDAKEKVMAELLDPKYDLTKEEIEQVKTHLDKRFVLPILQGFISDPKKFETYARSVAVDKVPSVWLEMPKVILLLRLSKQFCCQSTFDVGHQDNGGFRSGNKTSLLEDEAFRNPSVRTLRRCSLWSRHLFCEQDRRCCLRRNWESQKVEGGSWMGGFHSSFRQRSFWIRVRLVRFRCHHLGPFW